MSTYGDQDYYPGVNDTDEDDYEEATPYKEDPQTVYMAFGVKGDTCIDIERYRVVVDWDTNATDYVYDDERITIHFPYQLAHSLDFAAVLYGSGWNLVEDIAFSEQDFEVTVERV